MPNSDFDKSDENPENLPCCEDDAVDPLDLLDERARGYWDTATAELEGAIGELERIIEGIGDEANADMQLVTIEVDSACDELIGAADFEMGKGEESVSRLLNKIVGEVDKPLANMQDQLAVAGVLMPWDWYAQATALAGDPIDMLAYALPKVVEYLTETTGVPYTPGETPTPEQVDAEANKMVSFTLGNAPVSPVPLSHPGRANVPLSVPPRSGASVGGTRVRAETDYPCGPLEITVVVPPINVVTGPPANATAYVRADIEESSNNAPGKTVAQAEKELAEAAGNVQQFPSVLPSASGGAPPTSPPGSPPDPLAGRIIQPVQNPDGTITFTPVRPTPAVPPTQFNPSSVPPASSLFTPDFSGDIPVSSVDGLNWNDVQACAHAATLKDMPVRGTHAGEQPKVPANEALAALKKETHSGDFEPWIDVPNSEFGKWVSDTWNRFVEGQKEEFRRDFGFIQESVVLKQVAPQSTPHPGAAAYYGARLAGARMAESKTGFPLSYLYQGDLYLYQYANPQFLPTQPEIDAMFLTGQIDEPLWYCWTRAAGNLPEPARRSLLSKQTKPNVNEVVALRMRGVIDDKDFFSRMRELGVLDPARSKEFTELAKVVPTPNDLIRFMVRDAADMTVVEQYRLDEGFKDKYGAQIQKWAEAQGVEPDVFLYSWRSHWEIPSNTQLYEMVRRLRPDRPAVVAWDKEAEAITPGGAELTLGPRPTVVTVADVKRAMEVNDLMPGWVDPSLEVSYAPITRTDAIRAYMIGAFTSERLYHAFRDNGYNDEDAKTLLRVFEQDKARRISNQTGTWTIRKVVRYYKAGGITRAQAAAFLYPLQPDSVAIEAVLAAADAELDADTRQARIKGLRRGYFVGEYSEKEVITSLAEWGVDRRQVDRLLVMWTVTRDTRFKELTVTQITDLAKKGLLTAVEMHRRLMNLGYTRNDADLLTARIFGMEDDAGQVDWSEVSEVINQNIRNAIQARRQSSLNLERRMKALVAEITRIRKVQNQRNMDEFGFKLEPITIG